MKQSLTSSASQWCSSPTLQHLRREQKQAEVKNILLLAEKCKQAARKAASHLDPCLASPPPFYLPASASSLIFILQQHPVLSYCRATRDSALLVITRSGLSVVWIQMAKQRCLNFTLKNTWKEQKPPAILFPSSYSETSHFIMVNILMETSCTLTGYGLFLSTPMFILTAWGDQRELICHKESNTTHTHTHTQGCLSVHFSVVLAPGWSLSGLTLKIHYYTACSTHMHSEASG